MGQKTITIARNRLINERTVESEYGIRRRRLQKMRCFGTGPRFRKMGSSVLYDRADIERWIDQLPSGGGGRMVSGQMVIA